MLHYTDGMTRFDHVQNEDIRDRYGVAPIVEKLDVRPFRWYGHVVRAKENSLGKNRSGRQNKGDTLDEPRDYIRYLIK